MDSRKIISVVNFVRGCEPRGFMDLYTPVVKQIELGKKYAMPTTFLLQYDAMEREDMRNLFIKEQQPYFEFGVWFENCRSLIEKIGLKWNGRKGYDWDWYVNPGFLEAYSQTEREMIIDEVFALFKKLFGKYPEVAGSWIIDAYSMKYMCDKYGMKAFCNCREQWAVDAYTLWGGYYNGGYYASVNNMLCPSQREETKIPAPMFRMLGIDPIYGYDCRKYNSFFPGYLECWTMEPVSKQGQTPEIIDWNFNEYYGNPSVSYCHMTTGQENSFGWENFGKGYTLQIEAIDELVRKGKLTVETLGESGENFIRAYKETPPYTLSAFTDWADNGMKSVWYNSMFYRANITSKGNKLFFRDITVFDDNYKERYLEEKCIEKDAIYDALPVIDSRMNSEKNRECGVFFRKDGEIISAKKTAEKEFTVTLRFSDGSDGRIVFSEDGFDICGDNVVMDFGKGDEEIKNYKDGVFDLVHNGFDYGFRVEGVIEKEENTYGIFEKKSLIRFVFGNKR